MQTQPLLTTYFFLALSSLCLAVTIGSCSDFKKNTGHQYTSDASIKEGKKLAAVYCASCHLLPDPAMLDANSWENGVLPQMGPRLGIFYFNDRRYPSFKNDFNVGSQAYPSQPVVSPEEWQHIIDYYTALSPDSLLPAKKPVPIRLNDQLFAAKSPVYGYPAPAVLYVNMSEKKPLLISDATTHDILYFDSNLQLHDSIHLGTPVTDIIRDSGSITFCSVGDLNPNNGKYGMVVKMEENTGKKDTLFKNLMRPVQLLRADLNADRRADYLVCEFGNFKGALSWYQDTGRGFKRHVIRDVPGAVKAYINDANNDGLPDIWVLFAQGDESIFLYINKGDGNFEPQQVLRFPPYYGSSSFELNDFNGDGFADIIYTCGDNADYSTILKPYHGVYLYLNDGSNHFSQAFFYPINGCYKAVSADFDGDGDLDIATIAFFADYARQPEESFVYFKNESAPATGSAFRFTPYSIAAATQGRWLTMDAGDWDGDGKKDLVLGNFSVAPALSKSKTNWAQQPPFLILKNMQP